MKKISFKYLMSSFIICFTFFSIGIIGSTFADFDVASGTWGVAPDRGIGWTVNVSNNQSFKDFHIITDDGNAANYQVKKKPTGWNFVINKDSNGNSWISFWGSSEQSETFVFEVKYTGSMKIKLAAQCKITNDGNDNPDTGVIYSESNQYSPTADSLATIPIFTEESRIIFIILFFLISIVTWILLRSKRVEKAL